DFPRDSELRARRPACESVRTGDCYLPTSGRILTTGRRGDALVDAASVPVGPSACSGDPSVTVREGGGAGIRRQVARRATCGSMDITRLAGRKQASSATARSTPATAAKVNGS